LPEKNQLAVVFTDVVGFTARMESNESDALAILNRIRDSWCSLLSSGGGSLVKEMGDGTLATFRSPSAAVRCSGKLQRSLSRESFRIRVGIHWGNVVTDGGDVFGDTVNVASRLEKLAPPGGVCLSGELLRNYGPGRPPATRYLGMRKLRGLGRLMELYALSGTRRHPLPQGTQDPSEDYPQPQDEDSVPVLTVMPLSNLGPENDAFYSYGITSDLVGDLTRTGMISVSPMSDVMKLQNALGSPESVAERLNASYLVTGTLWRKDRSFHLSVELKDLARRRLLWADSWSDNWLELPQIKTKMADSLLKALGREPEGLGTVSAAEGSKAYELYLEGSSQFWHRKSYLDVERARKLLVQALELDPGLVHAKVLLGTSYTETDDLETAGTILEEAYDIAQNKGDRSGHHNALNRIGINFWRKGEFREARRIFLQTLRLAKTLGDPEAEARSLSNIGLMECNLGESAKALQYFEKALSMCLPEEISSLRANTLCNIGLVYWSSGENGLALEYYEKSLRILRELEDLDGQANLMMNLGIVTRALGHFDESMDYTREALRINTELGDRKGVCQSGNNLGNLFRFVGMDDKALEYYSEAERMADLIDDPMMRSILKTNMGIIKDRNGDSGTALLLYSEALEISRRLCDWEGEAENLTLIGILHRRASRFDKAKECLETSLGIMEEAGAHARTGLTRAHLAGVLLEINAQGAVKEALSHKELVDQLLSPTMSDRSETLWELYLLCGKLSALATDSHGDSLTREASRYHDEAVQAVMEIAGGISNPLLRQSFIGGHHTKLCSHESPETSKKVNMPF